MPCFCPPWEISIEPELPPSTERPLHRPALLLLLALFSLWHRRAFICPSCARSRSLFSPAWPCFPQACWVGFGGRHTHTHTLRVMWGGKGWFGNPAKYFIHGSAICLRSLIPIWCYLLSLSSRGFLFFLHILFSGQIISSYQPFSINTQTYASQQPPRRAKTCCRGAGCCCF